MTNLHRTEQGSAQTCNHNHPLRASRNMLGPTSEGGVPTVVVEQIAIRLEFRMLTAGIYRAFGCDNLLQQFGSYRNFTGEGAAISGDQEDRQRNAGRKEDQG